MSKSSSRFQRALARSDSGEHERREAGGFDDPNANAVRWMCQGAVCTVADRGLPLKQITRTIDTETSKAADHV